MQKNEDVIGVATAFSSATSTVIVIPKQLNISPGTKFVVKKDSEGRIIYEQQQEATA